MEKLENYLNTKDYQKLHASEIASLLKELDDITFAKAIVKIPKEIIGGVALELPDRYFDNIIESFNISDLSIAVSELESDDQTDFIQELEEHDISIANAVFEQLNKKDQADILELKQYKETEAGAYMQTEVFYALKEEKTKDVIKRFAKLKANNSLENVQYLFVTNKDGKLDRGVGLDSLLIFDFEKSLDYNITTKKESFEPIFAYDTQSIDEVVQQFQEYDLSVLPIVDKNSILLGRITSDDIYDIINDQATEQMYNLAGVDDGAEEDDNIYQAGKTRGIWLGVNLITAILASLAIAFFEETLQNLVALAILMPIVASMGGNAGTQSLTVVVRQLALGDISSKDAKRIIKKEVLISLGNGLIFAVIMGTIASLWFNIHLLGTVIALSMIINLLSAGFFGAVVPFVLKKFNVDPAIGSAVVLTTITDIVGFISFLGLATLIL
jgi:magnesium transporter